MAGTVAAMTACLLLRWLEPHRRAVHAITLAGGRRAVREQVPQMPTAAAAMHLGADHEKAAVLMGLHRIVQRREEARPAGAALELGAGGEQLLATPRTHECAAPLFDVQRAGAGPFRAVLAQHGELLRRQLPPPLLLAVLHREVLRRRLGAASEQPPHSCSSGLPSARTLAAAARIVRDSAPAADWSRCQPPQQPAAACRTSPAPRRWPPPSPPARAVATRSCWRGRWGPGRRNSPGRSCAPPAWSRRWRCPAPPSPWCRATTHGSDWCITSTCGGWRGRMRWTNSAGRRRATTSCWWSGPTGWARSARTAR